MNVDNASPTILHWDIDRYAELQDRAWHLDALGAERDRIAKRDGRSAGGETNRTTAGELRTEAAGMLSKYWDELRPPVTRVRSSP